MVQGAGIQQRRGLERPEGIPSVRSFHCKCSEFVVKWSCRFRSRCELPLSTLAAVPNEGMARRQAWCGGYRNSLTGCYGGTCCREAFAEHPSTPHGCTAVAVMIWKVVTGHTPRGQACGGGECGGERRAAGVNVMAAFVLEAVGTVCVWRQRRTLRVQLSLHSQRVIMSAA